MKLLMRWCWPGTGLLRYHDRDAIVLYLDLIYSHTFACIGGFVFDLTLPLSIIFLIHD
jgi:hypothetical protein